MSLLQVVVSVTEQKPDTQFDPNTVSPGVAGFFAVAVLAVGIIFLGFDLVRRMRRSRYRADVREQIEQELAGNGAAGAADAGAAETSAADAGAAESGAAETGAAGEPKPGSRS